LSGGNAGTHGSVLFALPPLVQINSIVTTYESSSNKLPVKSIRKMFSFNFELLSFYHTALRVFLSCIRYWFPGKKNKHNQQHKQRVR
jgi:hypothetical protein